MILEKIFPIHYYNELSGLVTDSSIVQQLLRDNFPEMFTLLEKLGGTMYLTNAINKWFLTIFINRISEVYSNLIWDLFLLEGNLVMFKATYALIRMMYKFIMECKNFKECRKNMNIKVIKEISNLDNSLKNEIEKAKKKNNKDLKCDLDWPICIYNSKDLEKNYDHIILKQLFEPEVIDDYFSENKNYEQEKKNNEEKYEDLLIERKKHFCGSKIRSIRDKLIIDNNEINNNNILIKNDNIDNNIDNNLENKEMNKIIINLTNESQKVIKFEKEKAEDSFMSD